MNRSGAGDVSGQRSTALEWTSAVEVGSEIYS
jgi:hypothetical protein